MSCSMRGVWADACEWLVTVLLSCSSAATLWKMLCCKVVKAVLGVRVLAWESVASRALHPTGAQPQRRSSLRL